MDERLIELSRNNPVVHIALTHFMRGDWTFEQALIECILVLAKVNKEQFDLLVKHEIESTVPSFMRLP